MCYLYLFLLSAYHQKREQIGKSPAENYCAQKFDLVRKPAKKPGVTPVASTCLQMMFYLLLLFSAVFPIAIFPGLHFVTRINSLLPKDLFSPAFLLCLPPSFPQVCSHVVCSVIAVSLQMVFTLAFCLLNSIHTPLFPVNAVLKSYPVILSISCSSLFTLSTAAGSIM